MPNSLKGMLRKSPLIVGLMTWHVTQPWLAKLWKQRGCDFVSLEYEHTFFNEGQLIDSILSNPQINGVFLGMYDLSVSFGHPGNYRHPDLTPEIERVAAARKQDKVVACGIPTRSPCAPGSRGE